ncbi:MAG TPA: hypothetical protein VKB42_20345 [Dongiaceae bacterium]|nr:hypothetical protein [Dongiaceae bacterium]
MAYGPVSRDAGGEARGNACTAIKWLAAAMLVVTLAGCQTGTLSYNRSTGAFELPFGQGSRSVGSNR